MRTNVEKTDSESKPSAKEFIPLLCPQCGGIIGEMSSGQVRLLCVKCKVKTIFSRLESDKLPARVIYLVIAPGDGYTAGVS